MSNQNANDQKAAVRPTRRGFIAGSLCAAGALGAVAAAGVANAEQAAAPAEAAPTEGAPEAAGEGASWATSVEPGTYTGVGIGRHGEIKVEATFSKAGVESVEVVANTETPDLSDVALTVVPMAIVANQSLDVDTVSGATLSSRGVLDAVADAADQAGADVDAFWAAPCAYVAEQAMTPGTYVGEAYGKWKKGSIEGERHGCPAVIEPTQVQVTVDETSIVSVEVLSCSDTPGFTEPALARTPAEVVDQQSIYVDTVTGSTMTSAAIAAAVMKCLQEAGADLVGFAKATPKVDAEESYDCDLVVVGAGLTGTSAALAAVEQGLKVVVIEKTNRVSGTGACSSGPFAVGDKLNAEAGVEMTAEEAFSMRMDEDQGRTNAPLVRKVIFATGRMVDWLQERWTSIGDAGFTVKPSLDPMNLMHIYGKGTQKFQDLYDNYILPAGADLLFETQISKIVTAEDGRLTAIEAKRQDGTKVTVNCKAAILCTGGFGGNPAMMSERLNCTFENVGLSSNVGASILLCEDLGCKMSDDVSPALAEFCGNDVLEYYAGYMKFINQIGFLMLDPAGARFMNEELCLTESNSIGAAAMKRASWSWVILTQSDLDSLQTQGVWGHLTQEYCDANEMRSRIINPVYTTIKDEMDQCIKFGQAFKADTLEGLRDAVGFDRESFDTAIAEYKEAVTAGEDLQFGKSACLLYPIDEGPFYAVRIIPPIDNTYNGIRVDTSFRALDANLKPSFPGLYLAGMDSGGFFTYPYSNFLGSSSSYCLTSGMLAAESAASYIAGL